jgi:hypothetical protein
MPPEPTEVGLVVLRADGEKISGSASRRALTAAATAPRFEGAETPASKAAATRSAPTPTPTTFAKGRTVETRSPHTHRELCT